MNTAFTLLPFTNVLWEMELTGAQVRAALEMHNGHLVQLAPGEGAAVTKGGVVRPRPQAAARRRPGARRPGDNRHSASPERGRDRASPSCFQRTRDRRRAEWR